jgi:hypothetical protein
LFFWSLFPPGGLLHIFLVPYHGGGRIK